MNHSFNVEIACRVGVNAAVIYNNIEHFVRANKGDNVNYHDGHWWVYHTLDAYASLYPYMTKKQVRTALDKLRDEGLVLVGNYNKDKRDRTLWYTIPGIANAQDGTSIDMPTRAHSYAPEGTSTIYDYKQDNYNSNYNIYGDAENTPPGRSEQKKTKEVKHTYGEYENVKLTDTELAKLKEEFPNDWQNRIENLSGYIASTGKKYTNHLATIRNWARKEQEKQKTAKQPDPNDGWAYLEAQYQNGEL